MEEQLKQLGFTDNEITAYLYLAKNKQSLAGNIAKNIGKYRPQVYDILQRLIDKGMVSFVIKSGKKYFSASPPEKILADIKSKEEELEEKRRLAEKIIPDLQNLFKSKEENYSVEVFEGKEGLKSYYEFIFKLAEKREISEILSFGGKGDVFRTLEFYFPHLIKRAIKKGFFKKVKYYLLWDFSKKNSREHLVLKKHVIVKFLPKEMNLPGGGVVFGDYLIIIKPSQPSFIVLIKNKEVAESFRHFFKGLWKIAKN